jgi:transcriptional regulator with XRE-family HTH domain
MRGTPGPDWERRNPPHPVDIHVGSCLRQRRTALGMSQEKLAASQGVSFQQMQKYERATNRISASRLYHLSKALDVPVTFFFEGITPDTSTTVPGPPVISEQTDPLDTAEAAELLAAYNALQDPMMRRRLLDLARALATEPKDSATSAGGSGARKISRRVHS